MRVFGWLVRIVCLAALLLPLAVSGEGDTAPPVLVSATPDRRQIDTSEAPQLVRVRVHVTDDLSGAGSFYVTWRHQYSQNTGRNCQFSLSAEGHRDVRVECLLEFPRFSATGRWLVDYVGMRDQVGNESSIWFLIRDEDSGRWDYAPDAPDIVKGMEIVIGSTAVITPTAVPVVTLYLAAVAK